MGDDIEHLKRHKIDPTTGRLRLLVKGQGDDSPEDVEEAFGGSGEAPAGPIDKQAVHDQAIATLKQIYDPEIPVNLYDLGLIYGVEVTDAAEVIVTMTLTAPACPVAGMIVNEVATRVGQIPGVSKSHAKVTWDPPWTKDRMTDDAKLELGLL